MNNPKVGFITFGDHRPDMWEKVFARKTIPLHQKALDTLQELPIVLIPAKEVSRTREQINQAVDDLKSQGVELLIVHIPPVGPRQIW